MPQHFQVLRCYKCSVFQVHQTKKTNKFQCKLCGETQSIKRHYGVGTGKDCRLHVQKLNGIRGELDELSSSMELNKEDSDEVNDNNQNTKPNIEKQRPNKSKWSDYVEKEVAEVNVEETMYIDDKEVVLEVPKKRFKKLGRNFTNPFTNPSIKAAKSNKCEEGANAIVSSNERIELSIKDSNFPFKSMNVPLNNLTKLESTQNCNVFNNINELPSDCKNYNLKPNAVIKEKFVQKNMPPVVKSNSKWAQFVENDDQNEQVSDEQLSPSNEQLSPSNKQFSPSNEQLSPNNEQFSPSNEQLSPSNEQLSPSNEQLSPSNDHDSCTDPQTLFSLCDDSDLDNVLDI